MRDIEDVVNGILRSDEPVVVLSSLARASYPAFSDACAVELSEGSNALFQVSFPMPGEGISTAGAPSAVGKTVTTTFQAASGDGYPSFAGVVVHSWLDHDPTDEDAIIARLLVDRALAIMQHERLAQAAASAEDRAAQLAIELITSRVEGEAIGILMVQRQATEDEAVSLLRQASWTSQRKLYDAAADIVHTADLPRQQRPRPRGI